MIGKRDTREIRIHPLVKVFPSGEEVRDGVRRPCNVFEGVVEILQKFDPAGLTARHLLGFPEVLQVLVVREDANRVLRAKEEGASALETEHYTREFAIVDVIVPFRR